MAVIRPFKALRPEASRAPQVAAVPYDVVNTEEARALASGNPWSFLRAQTGPVFLTYRAQAKIDALVKGALQKPQPLYDFIANDDIRHTIWRVENSDAFVEAFADVPYLYIADGHHRAASASRARAELKEQGFGFIGNEEYNFFLCVLFPDGQLQILPYNRIVRDLNGMSREEFLAGVRENFR